MTAAHAAADAMLEVDVWSPQVGVAERSRTKA
jgi:hypothetical protein